MYHILWYIINFEIYLLWYTINFDRFWNVTFIDDLSHVFCSSLPETIIFCCWNLSTQRAISSHVSYPPTSSFPTRALLDSGNEQPVEIFSKLIRWIFNLDIYIHEYTLIPKKHLWNNDSKYKMNYWNFKRKSFKNCFN